MMPMPGEICATPLDLTKPEYWLRDEGPNVSIFQCPCCGQLVLDDILGWKGCGLVGHATEETIQEYLRTGQLKRLL